MNLDCGSRRTSTLGSSLSRIRRRTQRATSFSFTGWTAIRFRTWQQDPTHPESVGVASRGCYCSLRGARPVRARPQINQTSETVLFFYRRFCTDKSNEPNKRCFRAASRAQLHRKAGPVSGLHLVGLYSRARSSPAEADLQRHFEVTPPSVHQMILTLEREGLIRRQPGRARTLEILIAPESLPVLR